MSRSPFANAFPSRADAVHHVFRTKFLHSADQEYDIVLSGTMDRVWRRWRWLWPVFWLLAKWKVFFPETGTDVPTTLVITAYSGSTGQPLHNWQRTFRFPNGTARRFNSIVSFDASRRHVIESTGPGRLVNVSSSVNFPSPGRMETRTELLRLRFWRFLLPVPAWITGKVDSVEEAKSDDSMHITLTLRHPLVGPIFGYSGTFQVSSQPKPTAQ